MRFRPADLDRDFVDDGKPSIQTYRFTVLTPTYNRAHLLGRVYESLCAQTFRDFEWLIIDDGSTDHTTTLVESWRSFFPIRYFWKPNGGKHTAVNMGVQLARGEFTLITDSDDQPLPHALQRFDARWKEIPDPDRFAFLVALCYQEGGRTILGSSLSADHVDAFTVRDSMALCDADRWGMCRTDVLRKFPYPVFSGERDISEGIVWNRILRTYGARYFNEALKVVYYQPDGLSASNRAGNNPVGAVLYYGELALSKVPLKIRLRAAACVVRFLIVAASKGMRRVLSSSPKTNR